MQVLQLLVAHAGNTVTREQLIKEVWRGNQYSGEKGLTDAIWQLRKILEQEPGSGSVIRTVPKVGYCLQHSPNTNIKHKTLRPLPTALGIMAIILFTVFLVLWQRQLDQQASPSQKLPRALTQLSGHEVNPKLSPDGNFVAFTRISKDGEYQLHVQSITGSNTDTQVSPDNAIGAAYPNWSQDSQRLAFIALTPEQRCEVRVIILVTREQYKVSDCETRHVGGLSWHSGQSTFVFSTPDESGQNGLATVFNHQSGEALQLAVETSEKGLADSYMQISPDGRRVAFVRNKGVNNSDIFISQLDGSNLEMVPIASTIMGLSWAGSDIIFSLLENNQSKLKLLDVKTATYKPVLPHINNALFPNYSERNKTLVYARRSFGKSIMALELVAEANQAPVTPLLSSPNIDFYPNFSQATGQLAFVSNRSGNDEVWLVDRNGEESRQLTHMQTQVYGPTWSPDGSAIAFTAADKANKFKQIHIYDFSDGSLRQITDGDQDHAPPTWSRDGNHIYTGIRYGNEFYLHQLAMDGSKQKLMPQAAVYGQQHPIENKLIFADLSKTGIWQYDIESGETSLLVETNSKVDGSTWVLSETGMYYVIRQENMDEVKFYDFNTQSHKTIMQMPDESIAAFETMALDLQNQRLIFVQTQRQESDLRLVEDIEF